MIYRLQNGKQIPSKNSNEIRLSESIAEWKRRITKQNATPEISGMPMYNSPVEPVPQSNNGFNLSMSQFQKMLELNNPKGYMDKGGRLFGNGVPESNSGFNAGLQLLNRLKTKYLSDYARNGYMYMYPKSRFKLLQYAISPYIKTDEKSNERLNEEDLDVTNARRALFAKNFGIDSTGEDYENAIVESKYRPSISSDSNAKYYTLPMEDPEARFNLLNSIGAKVKLGFGEDDHGRYLSVYDIWDLAPISGKGNEFKNTTPPEIYDRFYEQEIPEIYRFYELFGFDKGRVAPPSGADYRYGKLYRNGGKTNIKPESRKNLFRAGGPKKQNWFTRMMMNSVMNDPYTGAVATASGWTRDKDGNVTQTEEALNSDGAKKLRSSLAALAPVALGGMFGGAGIGGPASTSTMLNAGKIVTPMLGMGAFNAGLRQYTPWKNWADFILNVPLFEDGNSINTLLDYYPGANEKWGIKDWARSAAELTNPALFLPYGKVANAGVDFIGKAAKYTNGVKDRLAESVVRLGDNAFQFSDLMGQLTYPKTLKYIFDPRAKHLAYELPFKYSGESTAFTDGHMGDVIDQWLGKSPVVGGRYGYMSEELPPDLLKSVKKLYPKTYKDFPIVEFETDPIKLSSDIDRFESIIDVKNIGRRSGSSGRIISSDGTIAEDPGRFGFYLKQDANGNYYWDNWDVFKFHPNTQFANGLPRIFRRPAGFVDSRGTPIIYHWKTPIINNPPAMPTIEFEGPGTGWWDGIKKGSGFVDESMGLGRMGNNLPDSAYDWSPTLSNGGKIHIKSGKKNGYMAKGGRLFDGGGHLSDKDIQEGTDERAIYARRLLHYAVNNPNGFWADTKEAANARGWLKKNAPQQLSSLYHGLDEDFKKTVDRRFIPEDAKAYEYEEGIRDFRDNEGLNFTLGALSIPGTIIGGTEAATFLANPANVAKMLRFGADWGATEVLDRTPAWITKNDKNRLSTLVGNGQEWLFRKIMPESRFTESAAPWINRLGQLKAYTGLGMAGHQLLRGAGAGINALRNGWNNIGNFGEDTFKAFTDTPFWEEGTLNLSDDFRYANTPIGTTSRYSGYTPTNNASAEAFVKDVNDAIVKSRADEIYKVLGRETYSLGESEGTLLTDEGIEKLLKQKILEPKDSKIVEALHNNGIRTDEMTLDDIRALYNARLDAAEGYNGKVNIVSQTGSDDFTITGYTDGKPVGYIDIYGNKPSERLPQRGFKVSYVANTSGFNSSVPQEAGVQQRLSDAAIELAKDPNIGKEGLISGEELLMPEKTTKMYDRYLDKEIIRSDGRYHWLKPNGVTRDTEYGPVYLLKSPAGEPIPTKMLEYSEQYPFEFDLSKFHNGKYTITLEDIFKANGGKIHVKPENRGKFTALKKRTGHSASWFKAHGTPRTGWKHLSFTNGGKNT